MKKKFQISNVKCQMSNGFTLVELLVVIAILSIVGILVVTIFTRSLRGINKSQIISVLKQNGQSVLENMDKTIRSSDDVVCPVIVQPLTSASSQYLVVRKSGIYTRFSFISNRIQQDNPEKQIDAESGNEETDTQFRDRICGSEVQVYVLPIVLTDTKTQSGVRAVEGIFKRDVASGFKDQVTIRFNLIPGEGAPLVVAGDIDPVTFETTILLR